MGRVLLLFFICSISAFGQNSKQLKDSILKYKTINPSLAVEYGLKYEKLTANQKPDKEKQNTYALLGEILLEMGLNASALDYLTRSVQIYSALPKSEKNFPNIDQPPWVILNICLLYTSPSPRDRQKSRMPSSA